MPAKRIYLAGPMTGLPEFNYPAFNAEAARLRALGGLEQRRPMEGDAVTYDPKHQLDSEERAELERYAGPFWPLISIALLLGLLIWSLS